MFEGVWTAIPTPFRDGAVDESSLRALTRHQRDGGVDGIVVCGTTGEAATMSPAEQRRALDIVLDELAGACPVVMGAGSNDTAKAVANVQALEGVAIAGVLIVVPWYNKPSQRGLEAHFTAVADASPVPVVLYNVPGRTSRDLSAEVTHRLSQHDNIVAIKDATGDLTRCVAIANGMADGFKLLSGDDFTFLGFLASGGQGCVSVASNIVPAEMKRLMTLQRSGEHAAAAALNRRLQPLYDALFCDSNPAPAKYILARMGVFASDEVRLPLVGIIEPQKSQIEAVIADLGLAS